LVCLSGSGVTKYDGTHFTNFTKEQGLPQNIIYNIEVDKSGHLWFGTWEGGVSRFDGTSFTTYTTTQGLAHNTVQSIKEDKNGNFWFGTQDE
jgi:ligand-binding sensor domain-containing protein